MPPATSRSQASEPAAESITPIACQAPGTAWQNACTRACGSAWKAGSAAKHDPRGAEHDRDAGPGRSIPTPSAAAAWSPEPAATGIPFQCPETSGDSSASGSHSAGSSSASSTSADQRRPRDVEEQRPRRVGDVDRALAGEPQPHVVLRQQHVRDPRVDVGLVAAQPEELRRREAGQRAVAGQRDQPLEPDPRLDLRALLAGALVVPEDRRPQHPLVGVEARRARASGPRGRSRPARRRGRASAASLARHQSSGSCSAQPGRGVESG